MGHANAAVRGRMSGQLAFVKRYSRPGDALHVGHWRAAVDVGMTIPVLLDHAEDTHRRAMASHAGRDRPLRDPHAVAEQGHFLRVDRHHELQRTLRYFAEPGLFLGLGFFPFDPCGAMLADRNVHPTHQPATGRIKPYARRAPSGERPGPRWRGPAAQ